MNLGACFKTCCLGPRRTSEFLAAPPQALSASWPLSQLPRTPAVVACPRSRATDTMGFMRQRQTPKSSALGSPACERARPAASAGRTSHSFLSVNFGAKRSERSLIGGWCKTVSPYVAMAQPARVMPNPSVNRTLHGMPPPGLILFWPVVVTPRSAGYLERYASATTSCVFSAAGLHHGSRESSRARCALRACAQARSG